MSGKETGDLTKRGGRFTPEFIWNVNWQDQVHLTCLGKLPG